MQTGSFETLIIGLKSGKTTYVPLWDRVEGALLRTLKTGVKNSFIRSFGSSNLSLPMDSVVDAYTYSRWTYAGVYWTNIYSTYCIGIYTRCWKFPTLGLMTPQCPPPLPPTPGISRIHWGHVWHVRNVLTRGRIHGRRWDKVLRVFLHAIHSHLNGFYSPWSKSGLKLVCNVNIVYGNLKSENPQDYAQKLQRNCIFMNSASVYPHSCT